MTSTIQTVQTALKTALEAIPTGDRPLPFAVRVQESDIADTPATGAAADVVIGFESAGSLGRTGSTSLDQFLMPITIRRRAPTGAQSEYDACNALSELLQDTVLNYHTSAHRVEQLLAPHPMDLPQAVTGVWSSKFVADLDVLTSTGVTQDVTTPTTKLTEIRAAVWNAINNWSEFTVSGQSVWTRKYQLDADLEEIALHDPGWFDLPAIGVSWGPIQPEFFVHSVQNIPATLNVTAWFPIHQTTLAEYRVTQILRALYQCAPSSAPTVPYIKAACGRIPSKDSPITIEPTPVGRSQQLKVIKATVSFVLTGLIDPYVD